MAIVNPDLKLEAGVTVDSKGQIVLPKDMQKKQVDIAYTNTIKSDASTIIVS